MKRMAACLAIVASLSSAAEPPASGPTTSTRPVIEIGHDTTRILRPLKPDGTPDYLAAINEAAGKGVTKDNNAAVLLIEALGPEFLPTPNREDILKLLDMTLPEDGDYFRRDPDAYGSQYDRGLDGPWRAQDLPELAQWLAENEEPLRKIVAASKRSRFYIPWGSEVYTPPPLINFIIPYYGWMRAVAKALVIRAHLAAGKGCTQEAAADMLAAHRLGCLVGQDPSLAGKSVGMDMIGIADRSISNLAMSGRFTPAQCRRLIAELTGNAESPSLIDAVDQCERYSKLESIIFVATMPKDKRAGEFWLLDEIFGEGAGRASHFLLGAVRKAQIRSALARTDWNEILRRANRYYDELVNGLSENDSEKRQAVFQELKNQILSMTRSSEWLLVGATQEASTQWVGDRFLSVVLPSFGPAAVRQRKANAEMAMTRIVLALSAYKAEKGEYPGKLEALVGEYLKKLPADLLIDRPFSYRATGKSFVLKYSPGGNQRDDGGDDPSTGSGSSRAPSRDDKDDVVFRTPSSASQPAPASRPAATAPSPTR